MKYRDLCNYEIAIEKLIKALNIKNDAWEVYDIMGDVYNEEFEEKGEYAVDCFEKAMELCDQDEYDVNGNYSDIFIGYIEILVRMGKIEKAREKMEAYLNRGKELNKKNELAELEYAQLLKKFSEFDKTIDILKKGMNSKDEDVKYFSVCSLLNPLIIMGRDAEVWELINRYLKNTGYEVYMYMNRNSIFLKNNDYDVFYNSLEEILKWSKENDSDRLYESVIFSRLEMELRKDSVKDVEYNSEIMKEAVERIEEKTERLYEEYHNNKLDVDTLKEYLELKAYLHMEKGELEEALELLFKWTKERRCSHCTNCKCWEIPYIIAVVYELMGNDEEAFKYYEKSYEAGPGEAPIFIEYHRMKKKLGL